ncbi:MAG: ATP-binding cassette domain-containing protein, partial [Hyphomicrobiales bacterium]|nr:ATP-binding cassette domain-containing protein [Hyphomicrobiales bacterium]
MLDTAVTTLLVVDNVSQTYTVGSGETRNLVLDHVSLSLKSGEIVALLGRSGCGKSTLLRIVSGLQVPTDGKVTIAGETV